MGEVTPSKNVLDSLARIQEDLHRGADLVALKGALAWGWHALGLMAYLRLQPRREEFDAWLQDYLHEGAAALDVERDARWEERERLSSLELIDLLSEEELSILKPEFYQGWQDRTSRCKGLRRRVTELVGGALGESQRDRLMVLLAGYHRLVRLPARVEADPDALMAAFPALLDALDLLVDEEADDAGAIQSAVGECRKALPAS